MSESVEEEGDDEGRGGLRAHHGARPLRQYEGDAGDRGEPDREGHESGDGDRQPGDVAGQPARRAGHGGLGHGGQGARGEGAHGRPRSLFRFSHVIRPMIAIQP